MSEHTSAVATEKTFLDDVFGPPRNDQGKINKGRLAAEIAIQSTMGIFVCGLMAAAAAQSQIQRPAAVVPAQSSCVAPISANDAQGFVRSTPGTPAQNNLRVVYQDKVN